MKTRVLILAAAAAMPIVAAPAMAQTYSEQQRWDAAQRRYDNETRIYQRARDTYYAARSRDHRDGGYGYNNGGGYGYNNGNNDGRYDGPPPNGAYADGYATSYDASRDYRAGNYQERRLGSSDQVYRGSDGRYYCKRNDGTTGLVIGGASGALLGNVIDGGHNRAAGTLIGGALGALLGKSVEQNSNNNDYRCR